VGFHSKCDARTFGVAFEVVQALPHQRIALLDDVVTTGSTAMAAIEALQAAGAREIELWAIARSRRRTVRRKRTRAIHR